MMVGRVGCRARVWLAAIAALLTLVGGGPCEGATRARTRHVQPAANGRPDRALFQEAERAERTLRTSVRLQGRRAEWERVIFQYRRLVARYPQSPYCDNALLAIGDLYRGLAARFGSPRYKDDALAAYQTLSAEYPSSSLGEQALYNALQVTREQGDRRRLAEAAKQYLGAFPDGRRAAEVKALVRRSAPERAASLPTPPPPGLARVFNLRFWSGESSTRVVVDLEREVPMRFDRIAAPERLWIDLKGAHLHPNLKDRAFPVGDGLLEQVRIGQNQDDVVRVVLDVKTVKSHSVFYLQDPPRLVIDVLGSSGSTTALAQAGSGGPGAPAVPTPAPTPSPRPSTSPSPPALRAEVTPPAPSPSPTPRASATPLPSPSPDPRRAAEPRAPIEREVEPALLPTRRVAGVAPQGGPAPASPAPPRRTPSLEVDLRGAAPPASAHASPAPPRPAATPTPIPAPRLAVREERDAPASTPTPPPGAPRPNRSGGMSLARQLGLGARRIVVDAGHGGHDPGTIGRNGLQEKDLVLDVALRLAARLREELGAEVVMTRATDVFIPLEERTAIANSKGADLFLSIHANSSRNTQARGIETYFLNFAKNPHAEAVAARENAISAATLKDLQGLVKAITLNSKIDESRDFAASVQEALVGHLREHYGRDVVDRGVHTAPFYVLIGANMPSILAEIAFVSHPEEERRLRTPEYRERIANSLFHGVRRYLEELNRGQPRQLTRARDTAARRGHRP
jgi:N-acetylmuramoyl-L-alanine amidase